VRKHKDSGAIASMALKKIPLCDVKNFGVVVLDENSKVTGFQEKPSINEAKSNLVNTGIYVFEPEIFDFIPPNTFYDFAKDVFPSIIANNQPLYGFEIDDYWSDIGTINQYKMSLFDILQNKINVSLSFNKNGRLWYKDTCKIGNNMFFDGNIAIGHKSIIHDNVKLHGNCVIGNNCIVENDVQIRNSIIWDNVIIEKGAIIDGCIICNNAKVGRDAVVLPGYIIPDACHISNKEKLFNVVKLKPENKYDSINI